MFIECLLEVIIFSMKLKYLNINSIRDKFCSNPSLIENNLDIFAIEETKLDSSFPESHYF